MERRLFDPGMLAHLADFYPDSCLIEEPVFAIDPGGEKRITGYTPLAGHEAIPCAVGRPSGGEQKNRESTPSLTTYRIALRGHYPAITRLMRAVVNGRAYDILGLPPDQHRQMTYLDCEVAVL